MPVAPDALFVAVKAHDALKLSDAVPDHSEHIMDVASIAAASSSNAAASVHAEAAVKVLKKAIDLQADSAMQLLQALTQPPATRVGSAVGGVIDTWA